MLLVIMWAKTNNTLKTLTSTVCLDVHDDSCWNVSLSHPGRGSPSKSQQWLAVPFRESHYNLLKFQKVAKTLHCFFHKFSNDRRM